MGHLSNPVGLRLGFNRAWLVKGTTKLTPGNSDLYISLEGIANQYFSRWMFRNLGCIYSHITLRSKNITVFLYDARFEVLYLEWRRKFINIFNQHKYLAFTYRKKITQELIRKRNFSVVTKFTRKVFEIMRDPFYSHFTSTFQKNITILFSKKYPLMHDFIVNIYPISNYSLTARAIGIYAIKKLRANNSLGQIFGPMVKGMRGFLKGLRIYCAGRFTRNQRASFLVFGMGKITLNNFSQPVDYFFTSVPLKFGVGSLKIWLTHFEPPKVVFKA